MGKDAERGLDWMGLPVIATVLNSNNLVAQGCARTLSLLLEQPSPGRLVGHESDEMPFAAEHLVCCSGTSVPKPCRRPFRRYGVLLLVEALRLAQGLHHPDAVGMVEENDLAWFDFPHHKSKQRGFGRGRGFRRQGVLDRKAT